MDPIQIINESKKEYNIDKFIMMFSGGKDSVTTAHYLHTVLKLDFELVFCNTGIGVKENLEFVKKFALDNKIKLHIVHPHDYETYEIFVKRFGFPKAGAHNIVMGFLKYHPLRKWYKQYQKKKGITIGLLTGRRLNESARRKNRLKTNIAYQISTDKIIFISPIYYWTNEEVWDYISKNNLELCPVYNTLHLSGDCMCGAFGNDEEKRLLEIFHKETFDKIIHLEKKYKDTWGLGNIISRRRKKQLEEINQLFVNAQDVEDSICNECIYKKV